VLTVYSLYVTKWQYQELVYFNLEQDTKEHKGIALLFLWPRRWLRLGGQRQVPAALPLEERCRTGGWVGPRAILHNCGKYRPPCDFHAGLYSLQLVAKIKNVRYRISSGISVRICIVYKKCRGHLIDLISPLWSYSFIESLPSAIGCGPNDCALLHPILTSPYLTSSGHTTSDRTAINTVRVSNVAPAANKIVNPLTPELNPSAPRCLTRYFTVDFASWTVHFVNICVKNQRIHQLLILLINYVW
jgi:hypothetical protein